MGIQSAFKRTRLALVDRPPDLVAADDAARPSSQNIEDLELHRSDLQRIFSDPHSAAFHIEAEPADLGNRLLKVRPSGSPAQHGAAASHKFFRMEGFRKVIVRTRLKTLHAVIVLDAGGEHEHRHGASAAKLAEDLKAVEHRHHHIQNDNRGRILERAEQTFAAIVTGSYAEVEVSEERTEQTAEFYVIVDEQQFGHYLQDIRGTELERLKISQDAEAARSHEGYWPDL